MIQDSNKICCIYVGLLENSVQGANTDFAMVGYYAATVAATHDNVTAPLSHNDKTESLQGSEAFLAADNG